MITVRLLRASVVVALLGCSSTNGDVPDADTADQSASDDAASDVTEAAVPTCDPGSKPGADKGSVTTTAGTKVLVRTPTGYDPTIAAPLIVVYAACCVDGSLMETFTALTPAA